MRQARGADHEREGIHEHVQFTSSDTGGVFAKTEIGHHLVQFGQQRYAIDVAAKAQLRDGIARELKGNENGGHRIGEDQDNILDDLGVSDALHATEDGVEKDNAHAHKQAGVIIGFQKA